MRPNPKGDQTIDFADPNAVLCLNRALLASYYAVDHWMIPPGYLCPPIPGRADYIHHLADMIGLAKKGVRVLDIGTGANCIYPIIGSQSYGWKFVASEIDLRSVKSARAIVEANPSLRKKIRIVHQKKSILIFRDVIRSGDYFDAVMCNPPFHDSSEAAESGTSRKLSNLNKEKATPTRISLNFGGQQNELWCEGGEVEFIKRMIVESAEFANQVGWFTSLVSKNERLPSIRRTLEEFENVEVRITKMEQGSKKSRFISWRFEISS